MLDHNTQLFIVKKNFGENYTDILCDIADHNNLSLYDQIKSIVIDSREFGSAIGADYFGDHDVEFV